MPKYLSEFVPQTRWKRIYDTKDSAILWRLIDLNGNVGNTHDIKPSDEDLAKHFENI